MLPHAVLENDRLYLYDSYLYAEEVKQIMGREYDRRKKVWSVPATKQAMDSLLQTTKVCIHIDVREYIANRDRQDKELRQQFDKIKRTQDIVPGRVMPIKAVPYMHQVRAFTLALKAYESGKRGIALLMDMGTGKTITSIAIVGALNLGKVMIICPTTIVRVWQQEFEKFADYPADVLILDGSVAERKKKLKEFTGNVVVINYESTWRMLDELKAWQPKVLICDESQRIKSYRASQSKAVHELADLCRWRMILSGTPIVNSPLDVYSQWLVIDKQIYGTNYKSFKERYAIMGGYENHQIVGYRYLEELKDKAHSIAYRVTKEEAVDLPEQVFLEHYIDLEPTALKQYKQLDKEFCIELEHGEIHAQNVLTKLKKLQQVTGGFVKNDDGHVVQVSRAKLDTLKELIIENKKKMVVFAQFTAEIQAIKRLLEELKIDYEYIDGSVEIKKRQDKINKFQTDPECLVFVAQLQTAGLGITLTAADTAIYYSLDYRYEDYAQSLARTHRIGQKKQMHVHPFNMQ